MCAPGGQRAGPFRCRPLLGFAAAGIVDRVAGDEIAHGIAIASARCSSVTVMLQSAYAASRGVSRTPVGANPDKNMPVQRSQP